MSKPRVSARLALALGALALALLAAAASAAGYLVESHRQQSDRDHRLAAAAAYVEHGKAQAVRTQWQQALTRELAPLELGASLTLAGPPDGKRLLYNQSYQTTDKQPAPTEPTATYVFALASGSDQSLRLTLYALPLDRNRRLLVALTSGLAALLGGVALLIWAASRWLIAPLRRLNTQVDAIAGGDSVDSRASSPIREVDNVATAVAGMSSRLARRAEQDARLEAEQRLLVSSIAHDLRTPLFSLRGYLDAIATGIGDPHERLDRARAKAGQIDRLVTDLFDYARADLDRHPQLRATNLAEAVKGVSAAFELAAHERGVELRLTTCTGPQVTIDPDGFERALANVLDNALRHTPRGSAIEITCGEDTDGAFVLVADDGPGIPPDLLPHIFEPLARADNARNGHTGGTGLGLTIAARLLQNQGGTIHAANTRGHGATLTLRLPHSSAELASRTILSLQPNP